MISEITKGYHQIHTVVKESIRDHYLAGKTAVFIDNLFGNNIDSIKKRDSSYLEFNLKKRKVIHLKNFTLCIPKKVILRFEKVSQGICKIDFLQDTTQNIYQENKMYQENDPCFSKFLGRCVKSYYIWERLIIEKDVLVVRSHHWYGLFFPLPKGEFVVKRYRLNNFFTNTV